MTAIDKYRADGNKNDLVIAYLPLIKKIANKYSKISSIVDFDDLVNEAICKILENLDRYNNSEVNLIRWNSHDAMREQLKRMGFNIYMFRHIKKRFCLRAYYR